MTNLLQKGLLGAGVVGAGVSTFPEDAEAATIKDSTLKYYLDKYRKNNVGSPLSQEHLDEITKWAKEDIPKSYKVSSTAVEKADNDILTQAISRGDFPFLPSHTINNLRAETAALPNIIHEKVNPSFELLPAGTRESLQGQQYYLPQTGTVIRYNPTGSEKGREVAGHELGAHGTMHSPTIRDSLLQETLDRTDLINTIDTQHELSRTALKAFVESPGTFKTSKELRDYGLYYGKPGEYVARAMGKDVSTAAASSGLSLTQIKNQDVFLSRLNEHMKDALAVAKRGNPEDYREGLKAFQKARGYALPAILASAVGGVAYDEAQNTKADAGLIEKFSGTPKLKDSELISQVENYSTGKGNVDRTEETKNFFAPEMKELGRVNPVSKNRLPEAVKDTVKTFIAESGNIGTLLLPTVGKVGAVSFEVLSDLINPKEAGAGSELTSEILTRVQKFKGSSKVKDLPISHAQEAIDFFNPANQALA